MFIHIGSNPQCVYNYVHPLKYIYILVYYVYVIEPHSLIGKKNLELLMSWEI